MESYECSGKQFALMVLAFLVMAAIFMASNAYQSHILAGIGTVIFGLWPALNVCVILKTGVAKSNWGTFRRDQNPIRFWFDVILWGVISIVVVGVGIATLLEFLPPSSWQVRKP
jgi:hypothetical protein